MTFDFNYMRTKIFNYKEPIVLSDDVVINDAKFKSEVRQFKKGIEINHDNVVIDGNGYTLDAKGKSRIFNVSGKNVIIKNLNFKNGFSEKYGGAIRVEGECKLISCTFSDNHAKKGGNDISNGSELSICHCEFLSENSNRSINNKGLIRVLNSEEEYMKNLIAGASPELFIPKHKITFVLNGENVYLKDARVTVEDICACTNKRGMCEFEDIEEGTHSISIEAKNYKPFTDSINVSSENLIFPFILEKIIKKFDIKFYIHDDKNPIEDAIISFGDRRGVTDQKGECIIEDVREGKYFIEVNADKYDSKSGNIFVEEGQTHFDIKIGEIDEAKPPFSVEKYTGPYIFSSYAHKDASEVFPELKRFHDKGLDIWYDEGIESGEGWQAVIEKAVLDCSLFIVFISPNAVNSPNVREEIFLAKGEKIPVIPIYLEETKLEHGLRLRIGSVQSIKKYDMDEDKYLEKCQRGFESHKFYIDL